jgi:rubrerythrin
MSETKLKATLEMAIGNENEAYEFYKSAASKTKNPSLISIFNELAAEELKHKSLLKGYLKDLKSLSFKDTADYKISESLPLAKLTADMKYTDAIVLAMKKEEEAMNMYKNLADASADRTQKETFLELSKMEKGHKTRLEDIYNDTAFAEVW